MAQLPPDPTTKPGLTTEPGQAAAPRPTAWARSIGAGVLFVVVAVGVQLARLPGNRAWDTIWAEDGTVFTHEALTRPALATLLDDYAGYTQFTTHVLALGTRALPPRAFAAYIAVAASLVAALVGLVVVRSARSWVRSPVLRWSLGVMVVIAPVTFSELNAAITNVGWPFLIGGFWAIASREEGRFDTPVRALTVLIGAMTTVTQIVLLPWAIVVAIHRRRRSDLIVLGSLVAGLAVQGLAVLAAAPEKSDATKSVSTLMELLGLRVFGSLVIGERWIAHLSTRSAVAVGLVSLAVVAVMVVLARPRRLDLDRRVLVAGAAVTALGSYVLTVWYRGTSMVDLSVPEGFVLSGGRYGYLPVLLLFSALVVMVDSSGRPWLTVVLLAQTAFVIATSLTLATARSSGPSWAGSVRTAEARCRADPGLDQVLLPISPAPTWLIEIDCDRLR